MFFLFLFIHSLTTFLLCIPQGVWFVYKICLKEKDTRCLQKMFWTCISRRERTSMVNTKYNLWATTKPRVDFLMSDDSPFDIKCWMLFIYHIGRKYNVSKSMCYFGGVFYMSRLSSHAFNKNNNETTISALLLLPLLWQSYVYIYIYICRVGTSDKVILHVPFIQQWLPTWSYTSNKECHHRYAGQHAVAVAVQMIPSFEVAYTVENWLLTRKLPRINRPWE